MLASMMSSKALQRKAKVLSENKRYVELSFKVFLADASSAGKSHVGVRCPLVEKTDI